MFNFVDHGVFVLVYEKVFLASVRMLDLLCCDLEEVVSCWSTFPDL